MVRTEDRRNVAKVRVYELAKELGVESKTLLNHLKEQGEFVRSASSTIEPPVVRKIREMFPAELAGGGAAKPAAPAKKAAPAAKPAAPAPAAPAPAAPAKPAAAAPAKPAPEVPAPAAPAKPVEAPAARTAPTPGPKPAAKPTANAASPPAPKTPSSSADAHLLP